MTSNDPVPWQRYWAQVHEGGRRMQVERAAADPLGRWLVADAPALVDEDVGIDPRVLHEEPDDVITAAREGFESYAAEADLPTLADRRRYRVVPVHVMTLGRIDAVDYSMADPITDANRLTTLHSAAVVEEPSRRHEAVAVTYQCPVGHEQSVLQPLLRSWTVDTCLEHGCTNDVVPEDTETRARPVVRFAVETPAGRLPCVTTGRPASAERFERLTSARAVHLTGISRLLVDDAGGVAPTYEVLAAEPA
ncbi:MAG: hypothetical protein V5A43_06485 [Haloarculaceae archaeon]